MDKKLKDKKYSPSMVGYWWLPKERQKQPAEWKEEGRNIREYYQGAYFFARIEPLE